MWENGVNYPSFNMNNFGQQNQAPRLTTPRVRGENGARAFQMAPNSDQFLIDTTQNIIWLAQTDANGYMSLTPYDFTEHKFPEPVDLHALEERLKHIEEALYGKRDTDKAGKRADAGKSPE